MTVNLLTLCKKNYGTGPKDNPDTREYTDFAAIILAFSSFARKGLFRHLKVFQLRSK